MTEAYSEKVSFDLRQGEIAVELPEKFDAALYFIGQILSLIHISEPTRPY